MIYLMIQAETMQCALSGLEWSRSMIGQHQRKPFVFGLGSANRHALLHVTQAWQYNTFCDSCWLCSQHTMSTYKLLLLLLLQTLATCTPDAVSYPRSRVMMGFHTSLHCVSAYAHDLSSSSVQRGLSHNSSCEYALIACRFGLSALRSASNILFTNGIYDPYTACSPTVNLSDTITAIVYGKQASVTA